MARAKDENKVIAIYEATLKLVLENGFTGLKMSKVAKEAKLATGTLYIYFKDKEQLINALYLYIKTEQTKQYFWDYSETDSFVSNFRKLWFRVVEVGMKQPEYAIFMEQYYRSPFIKEDSKVQGEALISPVYQLLERGKAEQLIKDIPLELLVCQLLGATNELINLHQEGNFKVTKVHLEAMFKMSWDAIKN
ncbi:TetR/AcrR family transcriptional regulator [Bernardetia sp.]|uniref:TetR/AcrR family transcriptional regulator n=1 Tax=Bernardetia sp. TaxID=1937974 RepID=UPI0025C0E31C|nr:TetR/AcrR family transcriptional regulator [Bernardetia sp.]